MSDMSDEEKQLCERFLHKAGLMDVMPEQANIDKAIAAVLQKVRVNAIDSAGAVPVTEAGTSPTSHKTQPCSQPDQRPANSHCPSLSIIMSGQG